VREAKERWCRPPRRAAAKAAAVEAKDGKSVDARQSRGGGEEVSGGTTWRGPAHPRKGGRSKIAEVLKAGL